MTGTIRIISSKVYEHYVAHKTSAGDKLYVPVVRVNGRPIIRKGKIGTRTFTRAGQAERWAVRFERKYEGYCRAFRESYKMVSRIVPGNRWEAWKDRHFPGWLKRLFPVEGTLVSEWVQVGGD